MGDKSKKIAQDAEMARRFEEAKRAAEERARLLAVRCAACKRSKRKFLIEMGGFVYCDDCIEFAYQMIQEQKKSP